MEKVDGASKYILIAILLTFLIHLFISLIFSLKYQQDNIFFDSTKESVQESPEDMNVFYQQPPQAPPAPQAHPQNEQQNAYYNLANTEIGEPELTNIPELIYVPKKGKQQTQQPTEHIEQEQEAQTNTDTDNGIKLAKVDFEYSLKTDTADIENIPNKPEQKTKKKLLSGLDLLRGFQQFQSDQSDQSGQETNQDIQAEHATMTARINGEFQQALNSRSLSIPVSMESKSDLEELYIERDINTVVVIDIIFGEAGKVLDVEFIKSTGVKAADDRLKKWIFAASPISRYAKYYKGTPFRIKMPIHANLPRGKGRAHFHVSG